MSTHSPVELSLRRVLHATRSLQTEVPLGSERSSGSAVRLPVMITRLMFVAAMRGRLLSGWRGSVGRLVRPSVDLPSDGSCEQAGFSAVLLQSRREERATDSGARPQRALRWARSARARASPAGRACPARA